MKDLRYSIVIEATKDPNFWGFYSPDLPGYTGIGTSYADAVVRAMQGLDEYIDFMREAGERVPSPNPHATIVTCKEGEEPPPGVLCSPADSERGNALDFDIALWGDTELQEEVIPDQCAVGSHYRSNHEFTPAETSHHGSQRSQTAA